MQTIAGKLIQLYSSWECWRNSLVNELGLSPSLVDAELDPGGRGKELVGKGLDTVRARLATVCSRLVIVCATLATVRF